MKPERAVLAAGSLEEDLCLAVVRRRHDNLRRTARAEPACEKEGCFHGERAEAPRRSGGRLLGLCGVNLKLSGKRFALRL